MAHEFTEPPDDVLLALLGEHVTRAWDSFGHPRPSEPRLGAALRARLDEPLPTAPGSVEQALEDAARTLESSISPARPLYTAYVGSTGLRVGVVADALAATYDVNLASVAGAADVLEAQAVQWLAAFCGFGPASGSFTSGGMTSNLSALLAARERALPASREQGLAGRVGAVYCSAEAHGSVDRAVETIGLGARMLRRIAFDDERRMRPEDLAAAVGADRQAGIVPVAVVATAGSTLTGAVDPLDAIADVCASEGGLWLHVDGAYGGAAARAASVRHRFAGLDRADSLAVDAHKWLGLQKSCSVLLLRDAGALQAAFGHFASYMTGETSAATKPVDLTFEYSRPLRSLKPWVAFRTHGADALLAAIEHTITLARELQAAFVAHPRMECLHEPQLSTLCFRHVPEALRGDDAALSHHNAALGAAVQQDGRVYLAPAVFDGLVCLRVTLVNFRTRPEDLRLLVDVVDELGRAGAPAS